MVVLIWMILLFTAKSSSADTEETSEILAEAGLCIVIPCHLSVEPDLLLESAAWYKCEGTCTDSDIILYLNNTDQNAESGLNARVSLLEPDLSQRNCSIIINDLFKSDTGLYQLRVMNQTMEAYVRVKDLTQKPTLTIPPLTEGQETTLTCTAPGLCSGSAPKITWIWQKNGENNSHIPGNITDFQAGNLTAVPQRHSSTLTFNLSAEHHGSTVTCRVSFTGDTIKEETVTLTVTSCPKTLNSSDVVCVSQNENGEVKTKEEEEAEEEGQIMKVLRIMTRLEVIIAFLLGCLLSTNIWCLARKCCRKKKTHGNEAETLEMVTSHQDPLTDAAEGDQAIDQEAAEAGGAAAVGKSDVEYSNLDFSQMNRQHPAEAGTTQGTTETEYAEIKKEEVEKRQDGEDEKERELMGKDEETKPCVPNEEEAEDVALYSTVKDVMEEVQD